MVNENNIIDFNGLTKLEISPVKILAKASGAELQDVVVIGWKKDGGLYFASSSPDGPEVNWLLDIAKLELLEIGRS